MKKNILAYNLSLLAILVSFLASCSSDSNDAPAPVVPTAGTVGQAVDLGLPSGTLWADHNLGASAETEFGNYYGFGDVTGNVQTLDSKDYYQWDLPLVDDLFERMKSKEADVVAKKDTTVVDTYEVSVLVESLKDADKGQNNAQFYILLEGAANKQNSVDDLIAFYEANETSFELDVPSYKDKEAFAYKNADCITLATYKNTYVYGGSNAVIELANLTKADKDAAKKAWGAEWAMPTTDQLIELVTECTWEATESNGGVKGYNVVGPNGNSIFLPFSGYRLATEVVGKGYNAYYWASTAIGQYNFPSNADQLDGGKGTITEFEPDALFISTQTAYSKDAVKLTNDMLYGRAQGFAIRPVKVAK